MNVNSPRSLKAITRNQIEKMAQMLAMQENRLRELEVKLQKETQAKANLMADFQHLLDQLPILSQLNPA